MIGILKKILSFFSRRKWIAVVIGLAIAGGLFLRYTKAAKKESEYTTHKVVKGDLANTITASGEITGEEKARLQFQTSGYLNWIGVKEGDWVEKWQAVASLDKRTLEKSLKQELIDYANERYDVDEERKENNITSNQFDNFTMSDAVKYDLLRSQNTLDRTVLDVEISDIALKYATLVTPIEGIVTEIEEPYAGVNITPATAEIEIVNPKGLVFEANIDEVDIGKVKVGDTAEIVLDAFPSNTLGGTIIYIGFKSTVTSGGGTAFPVKIKPNNTDNLRIGMNGDITVITDKKEGVLTIPFEALREEEGKTFVYILKEGKPEEKEVTIGAATDTDYEIESGLMENEEVIIAGLKDTFQ